MRLGYVRCRMYVIHQDRGFTLSHFVPFGTRFTEGLIEWVLPHCTSPGYGGVKVRHIYQGIHEGYLKWWWWWWWGVPYLHIYLNTRLNDAGQSPVSHDLAMHTYGAYQAWGRSECWEEYRVRAGTSIEIDTRPRGTKTECSTELVDNILRGEICWGGVLGTGLLNIT